MIDSHITITIGPKQPRECGCNGSYNRCLCEDEGYRVMMSLAKVSSRFARTTLFDEVGGAIVLGDDDADMDIELF